MPEKSEGGGLVFPPLKLRSEFEKIRGQNWTFFRKQIFEKFAARAYEVTERTLKLKTRLNDGVEILKLSRHIASLVKASGLAAGDFLSPTPADSAFALDANFTDRQRDEVIRYFHHLHSQLQFSLIFPLNLEPMT